MPRIVDYDEVLRTAETAGFRCGYPNGAAFVLPKEAMTPAHVACWSAGDDATIKAPWHSSVRRVAAGELVPLAVRAWREAGGDAWLAPIHHWAASLQHGDGDWLEPLLVDLNVDPAPLRPRTQADALAFSPDEADAFALALASLLDNLDKGDFALLLPAASRGLFCTVHHHRQLWWQCAAEADAARLRGFASAG